MSKRHKQRWLEYLSIELTPVSHTERLVSALGGFLGIYGILQISLNFVAGGAAVLIVASMGASAVLLFAVPHGPLSQPWPLIGGHTVAAIVGVSCARVIPDTAVSAALAVSLAIALMHYLRCIHPPGGATALSAVVGGASVQELGYQFVLTPVLLNVLVIFVVALIFNYPFAWRRYPASLKSVVADRSAPDKRAISHEDLVYALSEVDSFIDVSERDLLTIYELATQRAQAGSYTPDELRLGHYYSNGKYGTEWSVRRIIDESAGEHSSEGMVIFKVVAGEGRRTTGVATRETFSRWAKHEVYRDDDNWRRIDPESG
jgi:CBS-domain-containing membrane protein